MYHSTTYNQLVSCDHHNIHNVYEQFIVVSYPTRTSYLHTSHPMINGNQDDSHFHIRCRSAPNNNGRRSQSRRPSDQIMIPDITTSSPHQCCTRKHECHNDKSHSNAQHGHIPQLRNPIPFQTHKARESPRKYPTRRSKGESYP